MDWILPIVYHCVAWLTDNGKAVRNPKCYPRKMLHQVHSYPGKKHTVRAQLGIWHWSMKFKVCDSLQRCCWEQALPFDVQELLLVRLVSASPLLVGLRLAVSFAAALSSASTRPGAVEAIKPPRFGLGGIEDDATEQPAGVSASPVLKLEGNVERMTAAPAALMPVP